MDTLSKKSLLRYPGGKAKLLPQIHKHLTAKLNCDGFEYREPFFGGGAVGIAYMAANPANRKVWINDKDVGIACLWTSVIRYPELLKSEVLKFAPSIDFFYEFKEELKANNSMPFETKQIVQYGFKKLAIHQMSYSGLGTMSGGPLGGRDQQNINNRIDSRWSPSNLRKKIDDLHELFSRFEIRENACTHYDAIDLIECKSSEAILYLDPPYLIEGPNLYQHSFSLSDHCRLADALRYTEHQWVLSYDDCEKIRKLFDWAEIEKVHVAYSITKPTKKSELIIASPAWQLVPEDEQCPFTHHPNPKAGLCDIPLPC